MNWLEAIESFLEQNAKPDMFALWSYGMEVQVNVTKTKEHIITESGKRLLKDGDTIYWPVRIPKHADTEPVYTPRKAAFPLSKYAEGIGLSGWNWDELVSKWVVFDFDSIVNHQKGLTKDALQSLADKLTLLEFVTLRKSTSGNGYHLYIELPDVPTKNHTEHAALAKAILNKMSAMTGVDLNLEVDVCGGIAWIWHKKSIGTCGFELVKQGRKMYEDEVPLNWDQYTSSVGKVSKRHIPPGMNSFQDFLTLATQRSLTPLQPQHIKLITWMEDNRALWWFDSEYNMLVTHTVYLKNAHVALGFKGIFETVSAGNDLNTQNCFCFPQADGSWTVRRYGMGIEECRPWETDAAGWTYCHYNREPTLSEACSAYDGIEDSKGRWHFKSCGKAITALSKVTEEIPIPEEFKNRPAVIFTSAKGKVTIEVEAATGDDLPGWLHSNKGSGLRTPVHQKTVTGIKQANTVTSTQEFDNIVRHVVSPDNQELGWYLYTNGAWVRESVANIKLFFKASGRKSPDIDRELGACVKDFWRMASLPFKPEYPGNREWNRNAPQLKYAPSNSDVVHHPFWTSIFEHIGAELDDSVAGNDWCKANDVATGAEYLMLWVANLLRRPTEPLPYLFLFGGQNAGKSIFHEGLRLLMTSGVVDAAPSIQSQQAFNKELDGSVLCYIEEVDLGRNGTAYNRIKDWVTAKTMTIHEKGVTPYQVINTTHWVQCSNDVRYCPIFPNDTRIVVIHVHAIEKSVPKSELLKSLEKEAPDILATLFSILLPPPCDRLAIPVLDNMEKYVQAESNTSDVEEFIKNNIVTAQGMRISFQDIVSEYLATSVTQGDGTSKRSISAALAKYEFTGGVDSHDGKMYYTNVRFASTTAKDMGGRWIRRGKYISFERIKSD